MGGPTRDLARRIRAAHAGDRTYGAPRVTAERPTTTCVGDNTYLPSRRISTRPMTSRLSVPSSEVLIITGVTNARTEA